MAGRRCIASGMLTLGFVGAVPCWFYFCSLGVGMGWMIYCLRWHVQVLVKCSRARGLKWLKDQIEDEGNAAKIA